MACVGVVGVGAGGDGVGEGVVLACFLAVLVFPMAWMSVAVVLGASRWGTGSVGCGRWAVLGGFLCWFVVGGCWGRWCCRWCFRWFRVCPLVRVSWRPVWALVAVLVWVS